uniref:Uncharacterized protein n=1 Tax=Rhizophora mucronata TaxID=61149 RepID=A0A2P2P2Z6_RHIMU
MHTHISHKCHFILHFWLLVWWFQLGIHRLDSYSCRN